MERAIKDLCQFPDADLFKEVAVGIRHVMDAVNELDAATRKLYEAGHRYPARVLGTLAIEEAAKVLVLIDAVRCPRTRQKERSRALGYFYDHLAKGIYAEVCHWYPADFAEAMHHVERERREHYLDGPNDVDWIFPNTITQQREDNLYVGYIRDDTEEDGPAERYWTPPRGDAHIDLTFGYPATPPVIDLARALHQVNATTPRGLSVVAEVWRPVDIHPDMHITELIELNGRMLKVLENRGLLSPALTEVYSVVRNKWIFPLWPLDLRILKVEKKTLRETRSQWSPDWY